MLTLPETNLDLDLFSSKLIFGGIVGPFRPDNGAKSTDLFPASESKLGERVIELHRRDDI